MKSGFLNLFSGLESTKSSLEQFVKIEARLRTYGSSGTVSAPSTPGASITDNADIMSPQDFKTYLAAFSNLTTKLYKSFPAIPEPKDFKSQKDIEMYKITFLQSLTEKDVIQSLNKAPSKTKVAVWACFKEFLQDENLINLMRSVGTVKVDNIQNGKPDLVDGDPKKFEHLINFRKYTPVLQLIGKISGLSAPNAELNIPKDVQTACADFHEKIIKPEDSAPAKPKIM